MKIKLSPRPVTKKLLKDIEKEQSKKGKIKISWKLDVKLK